MTHFHRLAAGARRALSTFSSLPSSRKITYTSVAATAVLLPIFVLGIRMAIPTATLDAGEAVHPSDSAVGELNPPVSTPDPSKPLDEADGEDETVLYIPPVSGVEDLIGFEVLPGRSPFLGERVEDTEDPASSTEAPETTEVPEITEAPETTAPAATSKPVTTTKKPTTTKPVTTKKPTTTKEPEPVDPEPSGDGSADAMVSMAVSQLGVSEKGPNNVKYNTWYYGHKVMESSSSGKRYAWCVVFLSWCADQSGVSKEAFPKTAGVSTLKDYFQKQGRYHKKSGYDPQIGDIVFFGTSHVGIVVGFDGTTFQVIEGNASDRVKQNTYKLTNSKVTGFGSPDYAD